MITRTDHTYSRGMKIFHFRLDVSVSAYDLSISDTIHETWCSVVPISQIVLRALSRDRDVSLSASREVKQSLIEAHKYMCMCNSKIITSITIITI